MSFGGSCSFRGSFSGGSFSGGSSCDFEFTVFTLYPLQHYASRSGHADICRLLLSSGASVNIQTPGGVTPLHRAAYCGHEGVVRLLLEGGARVTLVDSDGQTPLHKVSANCHFFYLGEGGQGRS